MQTARPATTWRAAPTPCGADHVPDILELLDATDTQVTISCVWGLVRGPQLQEVFQISDGGRSWKLVATTSKSHRPEVGTIPDYGGLLSQDTVASVGSTIWMQSSFIGLLESRDGGYRWAPVRMSAGGRALQAEWIAMRPSGRGALLGAVAGFSQPYGWWATQSDGRTWTMKWRVR